MRVLRSASASALGLTVLLGSASAYAGDPAAAREQLKVGYQLAQDNKCEEAIPHFTESLRLDAKAITLINLANCEEKIGRLADASGHWVDARSRAQSEGNAAIEAEAVKRSKALEPRIPRLTIALAPGSPKDAEVSRDGVVLGPVSIGVALPVNVGVHSIVVKAPGYEDGAKEVSVAESENKKIEAGPGAKKAVAATTNDAGKKPVPGDRAGTSGSSFKPGPMVYGGFGAAIVGIAAGTVTGIMAMSRASSLDSDCPNRVCSRRESLDQWDDGKMLGTISTVSFIVAGVGAAVGVAGIFWGSKKGDDRAVSLMVGPTGGGFRGTF